MLRRAAVEKESELARVALMQRQHEIEVSLFASFFSFSCTLTHRAVWRRWWSDCTSSVAWWRLCRRSAPQPCWCSSGWQSLEQCRSWYILV